MNIGERRRQWFVRNPRCQLEAVAKIGKARGLGMRPGFLTAHPISPQCNLAANRGQLGTRGDIDIETGGDDHSVEAVFGLRRRYGNTVFFATISSHGSPK